MLRRHILALGAVLALSGSATQALAQEQRLHLANWTDYTSPDLLKKFEAETGITVTLDQYDSNETILAKLQGGNTGYDLIVISHDFVPIFRDEGLIQKLDPAGLPGFANVDARYRSPAWDPENAYAHVWASGLTSFVYDQAVLPGTVDSLQTLFEPPAEVSGKVAMLASPSEVISLASVYLGLPQCTTTAADLQKIQALLMAQRPHVQTYSSDAIVDRLSAGEAAMQMSWSGDARRARANRPSLRFVFPKEGMIGFVDSLVMPTGAPHPENARKFVDFMMQPENAAIQAEYVGFPAPISAALPLISEELRSAPEFNYPPGITVSFKPACPPEATRAQDAIWSRLRG